MIFSELEILDQCHLKVDKVQVCTRRPPIGAPATPEVDQDYYYYPQLGFLREGDNHPLTLFTSPGTLSCPYSSLSGYYWLSCVPKFIALQPWCHDKNLLGAWEGFCVLQIHALLSLELRLAALHFEAGKHDIDLNALTLFLSYISTASILIIKNRALTLSKFWGTLNLGQKQYFWLQFVCHKRGLQLKKSNVSNHKKIKHHNLFEPEHQEERQDDWGQNWKR